MLCFGARNGVVKPNPVSVCTGGAAQLGAKWQELDAESGRFWLSHQRGEHRMTRHILAATVLALLVGCDTQTETLGDLRVLSFAYSSGESWYVAAFPRKMPVGTRWRVLVTAEFAFEGVPAAEGVLLVEWDIAHWCQVEALRTMVESPDAACEGRLFSDLSVEIGSDNGTGTAVLSIRRDDGEVVDRITFEVVE